MTSHGILSIAEVTTYCILGQSGGRFAFDWWDGTRLDRSIGRRHATVGYGVLLMT